jgi:chorismate lyase / 3-hydroxybenzoate synthase
MSLPLALFKPGPLRLRGDDVVAGTRPGALGWGLAGGLPLPLLDGGPALDVLLGPGPVRVGHSGAVRWWRVGDWAFGELELPDAVDELAAAAHQAYRALFEALDTSGCPHPLRLWNYLPRINADGGGLERYRQFNIGRQRAFLEAGRPAFEGAPAACALGRPDGGLSLRFLAGVNAPRPLENPRQVPAWRYSSRFGPRSPTFSRAALSALGPRPGAAEPPQVVLWVSGTASIVGEDSCHPGDLAAQVAETVTNLRALIAAANAALRPAAGSAGFVLEELDFTLYVRHAADAAAAQAHFARALGAVPDCVTLQADICRAELLVEIEAHGGTAGVLA